MDSRSLGSFCLRPVLVMALSKESMVTTPRSPSSAHRLLNRTSVGCVGVMPGNALLLLLMSPLPGTDAGSELRADEVYRVRKDDEDDVGSDDDVNNDDNVAFGLNGVNEEDERGSKEEHTREEAGCFAMRFSSFANAAFSIVGGDDDEEMERRFLRAIDVL